MLTVLWVCRPHGLREKRRGYKHARISGLLWVQTLLGTRYSRRWKIKIWKKRRACRITQGAGSLPCALRVTASQNVRPHIRLRFDFLFVLTIEIASYSQNPGRFALKRTSGIAAKPAGLKHSGKPNVKISARGFCVGDAVPGEVVDSQTVCDCKGNGFAPPLDEAPSGRCTAVPGSTESRRNVVIPNWHNSQSWRRPGAVAAL
jgi:hypothetical protein